MFKNEVHCLLTVEEMERADAAAIALGISGERLMEAAGKAVAHAAISYGQKRISVLCGPGNNGGDGFVAARYLRDAGYQVRVGLLGSIESLKGDARANAKRWTGATEPLSPDVLTGADCVIDAVFGAGLAREINGTALKTIEAIGNRHCIAVDVPSGIDGNTGEVMGIAPKAHKTITFFRAKPGHFLYPGRLHCGETDVVDIGIPESVLEDIQPNHWRNGPSSWPAQFPWPEPDNHKYSRGHAIIVGGGETTGAARLAVQGAMRAGAGMVSLVTPTEASVVYRITLPGAIIRPVLDTGMFREIIAEPRVSAC
ncbi:MAG: Bifunctional NAD(P)H-hydrate repair enzyme Nnr, partial [Alphaproteobacteria bacterium MarineAlpha4_Bin2]